ncbi:major facilitator superfamily domain-containing protein [Dichotomocladium elegans]|nr:major facilitator superfamily domain-containing protein [Dichotomocladium elegans]
MAREETTPLLKNSPPKYQAAAGSDAYDDDHIDVLTSSNSSSSNSTAEVNAAEDPDDIVARRLNGAHLLTVLGSLWVAVSLGSLDSSIVSTIYAQIGTEFQRSNEIVWIATSYMLSYTALQPLYGRISDVFGRKSALQFATVVFFIGSLMCGMSTNLWALVISRAVAGIGGGGINTLTSVITSDLVPMRERGKYQGYGNMAFGVGSVLGGPLGGFITDTIGWRFCFYLNLPLLTVTIYVASYVLTNYNLEERDDNLTLSQRLKQIDYLGATTIVLAVVAFLVASSLGGNIRPWTDPVVLGCLAASVVLTVIFCWIEKNVASNPLMPWHIVTAQSSLACSFVCFFTLMTCMASIYITPLYIQVLLGNSPTVGGMFQMPKIAVTSTGSILSGVWMSRTGEYRKLTLAMSGVMFGAVLFYTTWTRTTSLWIVITSLCVEGFAFGVLITTTLIALLSTVQASEMATITSMSYLFRSAGGVIGISATSAAFQGIVKNILVEKITGPDAAKYIDIARQSMNEVRSLLPPDVLDIVLDTYETGLRYTFLLMAAMAGLGFLCSFFIQSFRLETKVVK